MMMNFINTLFPNGFSDTEDEYGVVYFFNNEGRGARKISISETMTTEIIDLASSLGANEAILFHSQPTTDLEQYPTQDDIDMFNTIQSKLSDDGIGIYNNVVMSKLNGTWVCTSFKDVGQAGNFQ